MQTDLLGGLDALVSVDTVSSQMPSAAQFGLSELEGDVSLGLQQGAQDSEQAQTSVMRSSGVFVVVYGCCVDDAISMMQRPTKCYQTKETKESERTQGKPGLGCIPSLLRDNRFLSLSIAAIKPN